MQSGRFWMAFHGLAADLRELSQIVQMFYWRMTGHWSNSQIADLAYSLEWSARKYLSGIPDNALEMIEASEFFDAVEVGIDCLNVITKTKPQIEIAIIAEIQFFHRSISSPSMTFYFSSPAGSDTICKDPEGHYDLFGRFGPQGNQALRGTFFMICDFQGNIYRFRDLELAAALAHLPELEIPVVLDAIRNDRDNPRFQGFGQDDIYGNFVRYLMKLRNLMKFVRKMRAKKNPESADVLLPGWIIIHNPDNSWDALEEPDYDSSEFQKLLEPWREFNMSYLSGAVLTGPDISKETKISFALSILNWLASDREIVYRELENQISAFLDVESREYFLSNHWHVILDGRAYPYPPDFLSWIPFPPLKEQDNRHDRNNGNYENIEEI